LGLSGYFGGFESSLEHWAFGALLVISPRQGGDCTLGLIKATYPGQVIHVDVFTAGITGIEGSNYSAIFTDEKSRKKLAINLKLKSDFAGIMTEFLARLALCQK
jgi:hypothetical protein